MRGLFPQGVPHPWLKPGVFVGSLAPIPIMIWRCTHGQLGYLALTFLVASLLCTPLRIVTGWSWGIRLRRILGLFAFSYASLHFLTYLLVDQSLNLRAVFDDIRKRNFILVGFLAFVLLVPLAITSTNKMVRRLGFVRWKRLHRLVYLAGGLGAIHFIWRVKADLREPLVFSSLLTIALLLRGF